VPRDRKAGEVHLRRSAGGKTEERDQEAMLEKEVDTLNRTASGSQKSQNEIRQEIPSKRELGWGVPVPFEWCEKPPGAQSKEGAAEGISGGALFKEKGKKRKES